MLFDCCKAGGIGKVRNPSSLSVAKSLLSSGMFDMLKAGASRVLSASFRKDEQFYTASRTVTFFDELLKGLAGL